MGDFTMYLCRRGARYIGFGIGRSIEQWKGRSHFWFVRIYPFGGRKNVAEMCRSLDIFGGTGVEFDELVQVDRLAKELWR